MASYCRLLILLLQFALSSVQAESVAESFNKYTKESLLWGPYRSQCYFGIRPRYVDDTPFSLGLMWFDNTDPSALSKLRHQVDNGENLKKFSWEQYDPRIGGRESIIDEENNLNLTVSFVKTDDFKNWVVRVNGSALDPTKEGAASMVVYMNQNSGAKNQDSSYLSLRQQTGNNLQFEGQSGELGRYQVSINDNKGSYFHNESLNTMETASGADCSKVSHVSMTVPDEEIWQAHDIYQVLLSESLKAMVQENSGNIDLTLIPSMLTLHNSYGFPSGNFHYIQKTFNSSDPEGFEFDIIYNNMDDKKEKITSESAATNVISRRMNEIAIKLDKHFNEIKDFEKRTFAMETLSNLLGGIGYFHGKQLVDRTNVFTEDQFDDVKLTDGREEGPFSLFTSVPSRGFFPRGFYWDEGFHILQIMEYDFDLAFEIVNSWFSLIDDDGWIAREIILGPEARSRVPGEFQVQSPQIANPPTILLAFSEMLTKILENVDDFGNKGDTVDATEQLKYSSELVIEFGKKIYPKLLKHFEWFTNSQRGLIDEYESIMEDDPNWVKIHKNAVYKWVGRTETHCLPSGLDDYPRAQPPDIAELHVDALSWVGVMARSMKQIAQILHLESDQARFAKLESQIIENLDTLHWDEEHGCYCDVTILDGDDDDELVRVCHQGYVSLLPFALKLMPSSSPKLNQTIALMGDEDKLFSPYGILSLSKKDEYFGKGEDYWRGRIWLNINYLCLDALKHYYPEVDPHGNHVSTVHKKSASDKARKLYSSLKKNLVDNIYKVWQETGFVYENYDPVDGHGTGAKQFTGWTALIVNIMELM
ncbi:mannosyl-oligosaccharide glucosidase KNAG_0D03680 [Huiozyma naganishii CBS 8797]|uniref:Mannosyl-oligosaccharide glucosidase n=1 Tax=Huiozyma naganishii (strain ATCC MYA-139 / BCRC 22969 / CBS 8797 / KCTC 17520 / NBRC 10181 / NCYC 3082 / Yp74L-3) TaxID=1071383 RepID=J7S604_HUIN7|nr:hypothetical protein KNAG_0D03680 [Kazachstania naganishii CBS 8797]CCK70114.1 hypothetical protein KNAG_0D03680 [Kazachstania naganishii CBS 8797]